jgi:hypothetical protein
VARSDDLPGEPVQPLGPEVRDVGAPLTHQPIGDRAPRGGPALVRAALEHGVGDQQQARAAPQQLEGVVRRLDGDELGDAIGERGSR